MAQVNAACPVPRQTRAANPVKKPTPGPRRPAGIVALRTGFLCQVIGIDAGGHQGGKTITHFAVDFLVDFLNGPLSVSFFSVTRAAHIDFAYGARSDRLRAILRLSHELSELSQRSW